MADSGYDGLSSVIINASKTNKLLWKSMNSFSQTTSITITTTDWKLQHDSSTIINDWSMRYNILYIQGDDTTNRITGAIKRAVILDSNRTLLVQLVCIYAGDLQYPNLYWKQGNNAIAPTLQWDGSLFLNAQSTQQDNFFVGSYMCFSVGLS